MQRSSISVLLAATLLATQPACIALSARAHVGGVADERGAGVQAGVTFGLGIATSNRTAIMVTPGVATGTTPTLGLEDAIEYVSIRDDLPIAWRAGFGGVAGIIGGPSLIGPHLATLWLVRNKPHSWAGHEKFGGGGRDRTVIGLGVETRVGLSVRDSDADVTRGLGASAALTAEWISLSTWSCC